MCEAGLDGDPWAGRQPAMVYRDISFSEPMRQKLLAGSKTQTRRVLTEKGIVCDVVVEGRAYTRGEVGTQEDVMCPYGVPGDRLWVRGLPDILLEITAVRAERLDSIGAADALAEGVCPGTDPVEGYKIIWDELNAARGFGWSENPLVWVITFARLR